MSPQHTMACSDVGGRVTDGADSPAAVESLDRVEAMALQLLPCWWRLRLQTRVALATANGQNGEWAGDERRPVHETTSLFALLWRTRVIRQAHAASHVPSDTEGEHATSTPVLVRPRGRAPASESGVRETYTTFPVFVSNNTNTNKKQKCQNDHQSGMGGSQSAALR